MADLTPPCDVGELLSAYLDGELRPGELDRVTEHLGDCGDCVLEFRELKETRAAVRLLPVLEMPEPLVGHILHLGPELSAYLDGELGTGEIPLVVAHLGSCRHCRDELHQLDAARAAVRALPRVEPPEFLDVERVARRDDRPHRRRRRVVTAAASIAAAAVVVFGLAGSSPADAPVDLDSFADRHVARASVESGFSILPAVAPGGVSP